MNNKFDVSGLFVSYLTAKGLPFVPSLITAPTAASVSYDESFDYNIADEEYTFKGSVLRKKNSLGQWMFMPVSIEYDGKTFDMPYAILNISSSKTIVSTPLAGGGGGIVNELISSDGYKVSIATMMVGDSGLWVEDDLQTVKAIYDLQQPVELVCALTDILFDEDEKIIIESISYPPMQGVENVQLVTMECRTDKPFNLIVE